jgi:hypothetical protein
MSGILTGLYEFQGQLVPQTFPGAVPLEGEKYDAVANARTEQIEKDHANMHATGTVDLDGHVPRVKQAMQAALTKYLAENSNA